MLMNAAHEYVPLAAHLSEDEFIALSRKMWGHKGERVHVAAKIGNRWENAAGLRRFFPVFRACHQAHPTKG